eukprot:TRINITY_DN4739_c0_g1_i1.p1 TRINITY_DN4739_c0_g1~~TRINITY_DN4739_c0_g1_i1.p1  ORF type:complete len:626 (+),score=87.19 TRINITY_DN4739_c0_g1_i1:89-1966(+)
MTTPSNKFKCGRPAFHEYDKFCLDCPLTEDSSVARVEALKVLFDDVRKNGKDEISSIYPFLSIWAKLQRDFLQESQIKAYGEDLVEAGLITTIVELMNMALEDRSWLRPRGRNNSIFIWTIILSNLAKIKEWNVIIIQAGALPLLVRLLKGEMTWYERRAAARVFYFLRFTPSAEVLNACMDVTFEAYDIVYREYIKFPNERLFYQTELLTDGNHGGSDWQTAMAMQWADHLRSWTAQTLTKAALGTPEEATEIICNHPNFRRFNELVDIDMTIYQFGRAEEGNMTNMEALFCLSLLATTKRGRTAIIHEPNICNLLRGIAMTGVSVQHFAIEAIIELYKDPDSREKADEIFGETFSWMIDFNTLKRDNSRINLWEEIISVCGNEPKPLKALSAAKIVAERREKESKMSQNEIQTLSNNAKEHKDKGNKLIVSDLESALHEYAEGIQICPYADKDTRVALLSNTCECYSRLKTKNEADPEKAREYNKLIIENATRTQSIQWHQAKTLWKRAKALMDEKQWKYAYSDFYYFIRQGRLDEKTKMEFNALTDVVLIELHPYTTLIKKYGPIGDDDCYAGPLWTSEELTENPKFNRIVSLIDEKFKDIKPEVVLERSESPTQEELDGLH